MPTVEQLGLQKGDSVKYQSRDSSSFVEGKIIAINDAVYVYPFRDGVSTRMEDLDSGEIGIVPTIVYDGLGNPICELPHYKVRMVQAINPRYAGFIPLTGRQWMRSIIPATIDKVRFGVSDFFYNIRAQF